MPFARVGAMPQPTPSKKKTDERKKVSNGASKPRGITIEDLKRQTAIRLAQEQQQSLGQGYFVDPNPTTIRQPLVDQQILAHEQPPAPSNAYLVQQGHLGYPGQQMHGAPMALYSNHPQNFPPQLPHHVQQNATMHRGSAFAGQSESRAVQGHVGFRNVQHSIPIHQQSLDPSQRSHSSDSYELLAQGKSKITHGLTVHELKEMTRARLQAESSDQPVAPESSNREAHLENRGVSPLDFVSLTETREHTTSRDSGHNRTYAHLGPGSTNSIPSLVQVDQHHRDASYGRQPQVSPLPAGFQTSVNSSVSASNRPKADTWENLSVASVVSENYGSESVYSGGGVNSSYQQTNELESYGHGLTLGTHAAGLSFDDRKYPASAHSSPSHGNRHFDSTIGGNRRRAMTQSPRAGSIHEDRPILHTGELGIPTFSASARGTLQSRPARNYSPVLNLSAEQDFGRPRLSSATSLPLNAHGSFELNRDRANTFSGISASQAQSGCLSDDISNALTESFLRVSGGNTTSQAGFGAPTSAADNPWSTEAPSNAGSSIFNPPTIEDLTNDMGSILKLSGASSDRPDRGRCNTYPNAGFQ